MRTDYLEDVITAVEGCENFDMTWWKTERTVDAIGAYIDTFPERELKLKRVEIDKFGREHYWPVMGRKLVWTAVADHFEMSEEHAFEIFSQLSYPPHAQITKKDVIDKIRRFMKCDKFTSIMKGGFWKKK